jgi:hypothetical protein
MRCVHDNSVALHDTLDARLIATAQQAAASWALESFTTFVL